MSRIKKSLAVAALAVTALAGLAGPAAAGVDSTLNHPSTYESEGVTCTKVNFVDGTTYYEVPEGVLFVVIKTGTTYTTLVSGDSLTFPKDISFVITCVGDHNPPS